MDEFKWVLEACSKYGITAIVSAVIVYFTLRNYLGGYLPEKGKNLAAKEDISVLTGLVKSVELQRNMRIKAVEANQQLRMAAVDRRLQAHQEAFTLWRKLVTGNRRAKNQQSFSAKHGGRKTVFTLSRQSDTRLSPHIRTPIYTRS